jgi:hypothetical protein
MSFPVEVECYSGYTFAERPTAFTWLGQRYQIERVLKQWRSPHGPGFQVVTSDGARFQLLYHEPNENWVLKGPL